MTEFSHPDDEVLANELAIEEEFPIPAAKRESYGEYVLRLQRTEEYWFGGPMDSVSIHRSLGTPQRGDDMFEHM